MLRFNNLIIVDGIKLFSGMYMTYHWLHFWKKKKKSSSSEAINSQQSSREGCPPSITMYPVLFRVCADNHSCCEFMSWNVQKTYFCWTSPHPMAFTFFPPPPSPPSSSIFHNLWTIYEGHYVNVSFRIKYSTILSYTGQNWTPFLRSFLCCFRLLHSRL